MKVQATAAMVRGEYSPTELVKFLGVIIGITFVALILDHAFGQPGLADFLRLFMGVFFLTFGSFKLIGYRMFAEMFAGYDIVAKRVKTYAYVYPFVELTLAALYITNAFPIPRDVCTVVVMAVGSIGVAQEIRRRSGIHCACLGNIIKLPLSAVSLVEDVGMGLMAVAMLLWRS